MKIKNSKNQKVLRDALLYATFSSVFDQLCFSFFLFESENSKIRKFNFLQNSNFKFKFQTQKLKLRRVVVGRQ